MLFTNEVLIDGQPVTVDGSGVTQPVSGSVSVSAVSGTVTVDGSGVTQPVSGSVSVSAVSGTVTVDGSGVTQPVSGSVSVSAVSGTVTVDGSGVTQPVSGSVSVSNFPSSGAASSAVTSVAGSATSVMLLALNAGRKGAIIYNDSSAVLRVKFGTTASATSFTVLLPKNSYFEFPTPVYTGQIDGIWGTAAGAARITELA